MTWFGLFRKEHFQILSIEFQEMNYPLTERQDPSNFHAVRPSRRKARQQPESQKAQDLRRPQGSIMTALIIGALISLERLKYYKYSGICPSAAKTFPDFEPLFPKPTSTSQDTLESMAYSLRTVACALLDQWEVQRIDELLSMPLSHTEHMAAHTEVMAVYWKIRLGKSWSHRYALETIPQVKAGIAMHEKLKARTRAREGHRAIRFLFLVLILIIFLWLEV